MKNVSSILILFVSVFLFINEAKSQTTQRPNNISVALGLRFEENKGQVSDCDGMVKNDILYTMKDKGMNVYFHRNSVSYQWYYVEELMDGPYAISEATGQPLNGESLPGKFRMPKSSVLHTYKVDMNWQEGNENVEIISENPYSDYNNYYLAHCPDGVLRVKSYGKLVYKNLYPNIDVVYYVKDEHLKYDVIVHSGGDVRKVKYHYAGAEPKLINGKVRIETAIGFLEEQEPIAWTNENKPIKVSYKKDNNEIELISQRPEEAQVIDPMLSWGTYYGNTNEDQGFGTASDPSGNVFLAGYTGSTTGISSGGHQNSYGGSNLDAFLVKFNSAGVRQWGTYYGGTGSDFGKSVAADALGNAYLAGFTSSTSSIATAGSHQNTFGGSLDGFVAKFDPSGVRLWGTYYGNVGIEAVESVAVDGSGNVFIAGDTDSNASIAAGGGHQQTFAGGINDAFIVKFNSAGARQWGSYYGGAGDEYGTAISADALGNVFLGGYTSSATSISLGGHQNTFGGGGFDNFIVKFNSSGVRQWGSYYGGSGDDIGFALSVDASDNVYLAGTTVSTAGIASGGFQNSFGGFVDAFLVKFNNLGVRQWATYYGGTGEDDISAIATDAIGDVFVGGKTSSSSAIASGGIQNSFGGGSYDAFAAKFNSSGNRLWGTYFGGADQDIGNSLTVDDFGNVFFAGNTTSSASISSGGHQNSFGGGTNDAFLVKMQSGNPPTITSFNPASGPVGTSVTISGTNFAAIPGNIVYFGATRATVTNATATDLTVTVPAGATYQPITVTVGGLTAYSSAPFIVTFPGGGVIDLNSFLSKVDLIAGTLPGDVAIGDVDGDGKPDLGVLNNTLVSILKNTSVSGIITSSSFNTKVDFAAGLDPNAVAFGDVNGDGKLDLTISSVTNSEISVLRNTSVSGSVLFASKVGYYAPGLGIAIGDLDGDGKPDLATGDNSFNRVTVLRNISVSGSITSSSFAFRVDFPTENFPYDVAIGDLDGDGKPDLAVAANGGNAVSVLRNTSVSGTIAFASKVDYITGGAPRSVAIGDIDGDGKPDLVVTNYSTNSVSVLRNTSVSGSIAFASGVNFSTGSNPDKVAIGDLDGDGKPDLALANLTSNTVSVFRNTSVSGFITSSSFAARVDFATASGLRSVVIGDVDGDGKPDLVITNGNNAVSVFRNQIGEALAPTSFHVATTGNDSNDGSIATPFLTIQKALTTATNGDVIKVAAGTYNEGLITQSTIALQGGYTSDFLDVNRNIFTQKTIVRAVSTIILNDANGCVIDGFVFDGNNTAEVGLNISSTSIVTHNVVLRVKSSPGQGINISGSATVTNNNFHDNTTGAIIFGGLSATSIFKNNILTNNSFGLNNSSAAGIHRYNCVFGNSFNYVGNFNIPGTGDINLNPQFLNAATDDFRLAATSPAIDAGDPADPIGSETCSTRINMGAYGGTVVASCTIASEPTQASNITFSSITPTTITVNFTNGNGASRLLVARASSAVNSNPVDGTSYTANNTFGNAQLGTGNYVVGSGVGPITVSGLLPGTTYHFRLYEFNGTGGSENYNAVTATGNPNSTATSSSTVVTVSDFNPKEGTPGASITITGANFGATISANTVFFGSARAVITSASTSQLIATVPSGAIHERISVVAGGQIGYSSKFFKPTFNGTAVLSNNSFAAQTDFSVGSFANYVSIADIDNDTKPDVLVSNGNSGNISVLLGTGTIGAIGLGSLSAPINFTTGTSPNAIATGDLDNDGKLDVAVTNATSAMISVFRNTTSGGALSFAPKLDLSGSSPRYVAMGDLDGDGKADLVVSNYNNTTLSIFRNTGSTGSISFAAPTSLTTQTQPYGLSLGDLDGDGKVDVLVANQGSNSVSIFRNTSTSGTIQFDARVDMTTGTSPQNIALGDIDGDGKLDIAVVCSTVASLFRNLSTAGVLSAGSFSSRFDLTTSSNSLGISIADLSGDGKLDLVVANNGTGDLSLFANTGAVGAFSASTFSAQVNFAVGTSPASYSVGVGDLNGDGKPDLVVPNSGSISVFENLNSPQAIEPTAQPTNMTFTNQQSTQFTVNFTAAAGSPDGYIAFMKEGSSPSFVPVDGTVYNFNEEPDPTNHPGTYTVLNDAFTSFGIESVTPGATLYFDIYSYNGTGNGINYRTTSPLEGNFTTPTLPSEPTSQASNLVITQPFISTIQVSWTNGNGSSRIVVARQGGVVNQAPVDGETYAASASFSSGDDLGGGNYIVFNGTGNSVTVTDIQQSVAYEFFVFEYNGGAGSENYNINTATNNPKSITTTGDTTPPVAGTDATLTSVAPSTNVDVSAQFSDPESGIASVSLRYRSVSAGVGLTPLAMTNPSGNTWTAQIPSSAVGELGVEYQMTATNGAGLETITNLKIVKVLHAGGLPIPFTKFGSDVSDYRIVSVPLELTDNKMSSVFGSVLGLPYDGKGWRMYRYDNGETTELGPNSVIEPVLGYWLIIRDNPGRAITSGEGNSPALLPKTIELKADWNQIGNPYNFNLLWADVVAANTGLPTLTTYNGDFVPNSTVLNKFSGGFVKLPVGQTMTMNFPVVKNPAAGGRTTDQTVQLNALDQTNWRVNLALHHGPRTNSLGGFGMDEKANTGFDVLDQFTLPRFFGEYLEVNHEKVDGRDHYASDIIPPSQNHVWKFSVASTGEDQLLKFEWDNSYFGNNDRELFWKDEGTGKSFDMRIVNQFVFDKSVSGPFKVIYGDMEFIKEQTQVNQLILHGLYPIPAAEEVTISFSLPGSEPSAASIEVVDLMGRKLWQKKAEFPAGYNEVMWLRNEEKAGIYVAIVKSGQSWQQARFVIR